LGQKIESVNCSSFYERPRPMRTPDTVYSAIVTRAKRPQQAAAVCSKRHLDQTRQYRRI
jgi:hypothetical protein